MFGGARNGYCSTERPRMITTPSMTIRMEMTIETIGLLMKKFPTLTSFPLRTALGGYGFILRPDLATRSRLLHAFDNHPLSCLQTVKHDVIIVCLVAESQGTHLDLVLRVNHHHGFCALQFLNGFFGHEDGVVDFRYCDSHSSKLSWPKIAAGIRKARLDLHGSGRRIHRAVEDFESALLR